MIYVQGHQPLVEDNLSGMCDRWYNMMYLADSATGILLGMSGKLHWKEGHVYKLLLGIIFSFKFQI